jgi:phage tail-like protein
MPPISSHLSRLATDPLRNFKFLVEINHDVESTADGGSVKHVGFTLGFTSVSGFSATTNAIPYRQGGYNTAPQMIPGQTSFTPISLQRGVLIGKKHDWDWFRQLFAMSADKGSYVRNTGSKGNARGFRGGVIVHVLPHPRPDDWDLESIAKFHVYNAWPTSISFSDLNAGDNAFIVSNLTLAHEGWNYVLD